MMLIVIIITFDDVHCHHHHHHAMFVIISAVSNYNLVQSAGISSQSYFLLDLTQPFNGIFPLHNGNDFSNDDDDDDFSNDDDDTNDFS